MTVLLGRPWYLERAGITFARGDRLMVEGSKVMEDSGRVVVARVEKVRERVTLRLRDELRAPL